MTIWIDAQLSPALAPWITATFGIEAYSVVFLGLRDADDETIFQAAKEASAVVMTKDSDFLELQLRFGAPPQIVLIALGNTSNTRMREVLQQQFAQIQQYLLQAEPLVEINERAKENS
jgi:predicted nuclease of predicted toxin-antitoxin system